MIYNVVLNGLDAEQFVYDSLDEAIAGATRLAKSAHEAWLDDHIEREIVISAYGVEWPQSDNEEDT